MEMKLITKNLKRIILIFTLLISISLFAQDTDKTVTLVVSGQGQTQDAAKQSALRNAIEQAFGTFISSNTEILNDELVKDEIVSVSNGNIQKFEILSEVKIPDGEYSTTLKATVSVSKLITFAESKGVEVEFKGGLFAINVKQQIFNEENEKKVVNDMLFVIRKIMNKSMDYSLIVGTPIKGNPPPQTRFSRPKYLPVNFKKTSKSVRIQRMKSGNERGQNTDSGLWDFPLEISVIVNDNFVQMQNYLYKTLVGISLTDEEVSDYAKLNKPTYEILIDGNRKLNRKGKAVGPAIKKSIYLRNGIVAKKLLNELLFGFYDEIFNFKIEEAGTKFLYFPKKISYTENWKKDLRYVFRQNIETISTFNPIPYHVRENGDPQIDGILYRGYNKSTGSIIRYNEVERRFYLKNGDRSYFKNTINLLEYSVPKYELAKFKIYIQFTIDQLNKVSKFTITPNKI